MPAHKLQRQERSAGLITFVKMHRDLVEWSARVASIDRELRSILRDLGEEGVNLETVLLSLEQEDDIPVIQRLWMVGNL